MQSQLREALEERQKKERAFYAEMLELLTKIGALRSSPTGIGDALGGLGDWLDDVLKQAKEIEEEV